MRSSWSAIACLRVSASSRTMPSGAGTSAAATSASSALSRAEYELLDALDPTQALGEVGPELRQGVELAGHLGEVVVERRAARAP